MRLGKFCVMTSITTGDAFLRSRDGRRIREAAPRS
jgi:hypothetical protein